MYSILDVQEPTDGLVIDLISLEDAKIELGITGSTEDDAISARITRASRVIADFCNRQFALASAEETFVWSPHECPRAEQAIVLSLFPIVEIASIAIDGADLDAAAFDVQSDGGMVRLVDCARWHGRVIVDYTGGYFLPDDAPGALQQACLELVRQYRNAASSSSNASGSGIRSITHGDESVTFDNGTSSSSSSSSLSRSSGLPATVLDLIAPFRRAAIG